MGMRTLNREWGNWWSETLPKWRQPMLFSPTSTTFSACEARMTIPSPAEATSPFITITTVVSLGISGSRG